MKQLKIFILILLSITVLSCDSGYVPGPGKPEEPDITETWDDIIWEPAGASSLPEARFGFWHIACDPNNGNIWAYSINLLYLSPNNGTSWYKISSDVPSFAPFGIHVSPVNGYLFVAAGFDGLYRSTDDGENWEHILNNMYLNRVLFTASGEIYIGAENLTAGGFVCGYSNDNGNTWIQKSSGSFPLIPLALGQDGTLYASSSFGVYRSTDGGNMWLPPSNYNVPIGHLTTCDDGSIFATTDGEDILKSTDKGVTWSKVNTDILYTDPRNPAIRKQANRIFYNPISKDIFVYVVKLDYSSINFPADNEYYVYRSANSGKNWKLENIGVPQENGMLFCNPKTGQMFIGTLTGVYSTKNYPK
jgi:hypothetical protein